MNGEHPNTREAPTTDPIVFLPKDIDDMGMQFGEIKGIMPPRDSIPKDFWRSNSTWGNRLFNDWFYSGVKSLTLNPKDGIDKTKALRHIKTVMGSFDPAHEDKEATCAYLFDLWFDGSTAKWERAK